MNVKKSGVRNRPNDVTPSIPAKTAMPIARRISNPAPDANTSGSTPMMNAAEVISTGRSRTRHASRIAVMRSSPLSSRYFANSTIKIAFLHASPDKTRKLIWVKTLLSPPVTQTPAIADRMTIGTLRMTDSGSDQLSYSAARTTYTSSTHSGKTSTIVLPERIS